MPNITLPTDADVSAVDQTSFVWDDLMDGTLTEPYAAALKSVLDLCPAGTVVELAEPNAGTGKTAKFINDNVTNAANLKIVTNDIFVDTFLTTSDFYDNVGNASNCYKLDMTGSTTVQFNEGGDPIALNVVDIFNGNAIISTTDLTSNVSALGVNDLANKQPIAVPNTHIVNQAGTSLDSTGVFTPDIIMFSPWLISNGFPAFEKEGTKHRIAQQLNKLPTNGILILLAFHHPMVQQAFWAVNDAMTLTGTTLEHQYVLNSETDGTGYWQAAFIKKTS